MFRIKHENQRLECKFKASGGLNCRAKCMDAFRPDVTKPGE